MNMKNDKGVTLLVLTVTVIVLIIITSITIYGARNQLAIKYLNYLYSDIDSINTRVSAYYLKNNELPVFENAFIDEYDVDNNDAYSTQEVLRNILINNGGTLSNTLINPNDDR